MSGRVLAGVAERTLYRVADKFCALPRVRQTSKRRLGRPQGPGQNPEPQAPSLIEPRRHGDDAFAGDGTSWELAGPEAGLLWAPPAGGSSAARELVHAALVLIKQHNSCLAALLSSSAMVACYQSSENETRPPRTVTWGVQPFRNVWGHLGNACSCFPLGHEWPTAQGPGGQSPVRGRSSYQRRHRGPLVRFCPKIHSDPSARRQ